MDSNSLLILLITIKNNADTIDLKKTKISDTELGELCNYALDKRFIINEHHKLVITTKGLEEINKINDDLNRKGIDRMIIPFNNYKIAKINSEDIYIP